MTGNTKLDVQGREAAHSRENRRLRREGQVPGVLYGGGEDPVSFVVGERTLRHALAAEGAVLELSIDGGAASPAVLKDKQRHPVRGDLMHVDFLRVDLKKPIQASVTVELVGGEDAPGVREGGILEHVTRELTVEALPNDIPETVQVDVSALQVGDSLALSGLPALPNVTFVDDVETTVIALVSAPRLAAAGEEEGVETETEVVGEAASAPAEAEGDSGAGDEAGDGE